LDIDYWAGWEVRVVVRGEDLLGVAGMRDRHCNIRDTWDIACAAAVAGGLYSLLLAGIVAGRSGAMETEAAVAGAGFLILLPLPYLLGWCALPGWWVMQWIGRRARRGD